jgi:DNA-binding transcriptional ArsR family regulator
VSRLVLNAEDLAKVRLSTTWGPFTEALLSLRALRGPRPSALLDGWAESVCARLVPETALLYALAPAGPLLDLHTVVGPASCIEEALVSLERAPVKHMRKELTALRPSLARSETWVRSWVRDLSEGDRRARRELVRRFDDYHQHAVGPYWDRMRSYMNAEAAQRARIMAEGGVDRLLATLHSRVRWRPPVLDIATRGCSPAPRLNGKSGVDPPPLMLDGRSLVLVPSIFALDIPIVIHSLQDETVPVVLVYPTVRTADDTRALWSAPTSRHRALEKLLGRTRARALDVVSDTCSTTELAQRIGVSLPTASHHLSVMRESGLITSRRSGSTVVHHLTTRGAALLED